MKKLLPLFLVILLFSCSKKRESDLPRLIVSEAKKLVKINSKEMINVREPMPLAWNFDKDYKAEDCRYKIYSTGHKRVPYNSVLPKYDFKIIIDTTYTFGNNGFLYKRIKKPTDIIEDGQIKGRIPTHNDELISYKKIKKYLDERNKLERDSVKCFPLLIYNDSKVAIPLDPRFIQEAKDKDGKWKPIEFSYHFEMCGTGSDIKKLLESKKYAGFSIIKYSGNFKTKIRVKTQINNHYYYSNEIEGCINHSQFDQSNLDELINLEYSGSNKEYYYETKKYGLLQGVYY